MDVTSSRYVDTRPYKTFAILKFFVERAGSRVEPDNKAGTRFKALCPFHKERTASFKLHNTLPGKKNEWGYKCFGCGRSGDIFIFIMAMERMEFWEALSFIKRSFPAVK